MFLSQSQDRVERLNSLRGKARHTGLVGIHETGRAALCACVEYQYDTVATARCDGMWCYKSCRFDTGSVPAK